MCISVGCDVPSQALFNKIGGASFLRQKQGSPTDVLPILAEVLKLKDPTMMSLELGTLVNKYPDIQKDHLVALLYLRSDLKVAIYSSVRNHEPT